MKEPSHTSIDLASGTTEDYATVRRQIPNTRQDLVQDRVPNTKTDNLFISSAQASTPIPSSSTAGFFQIPPHVLNQFHDDSALLRALKLFLPSNVNKQIAPELNTFGDKVLSLQVLSWVLDAERNPPYVKTFDSWGRRCDTLITSEGWRNLQALGIAEGIVAIPYQNDLAEYSRVHQFAKYTLWCGSSAWVNCPSLMVDGVASLLRQHLTDSHLPAAQRPILQSAYDRLTSRDPSHAWTTGQWMTERQGGSDVSMTETLATYSPDPSLDSERRVRSTDDQPLGPWLLNGFKWFSSATDASMMVLLARSTKGVSLFYAPMRKTLSTPDVLGATTELNGVKIQRLKAKLGTRALPTAELELSGMRGWLIGDEGRGTKEIATVLNIARIHNGFSAIGFWGRGLGIVRAFTRVRVVGRRPLWERAAFMRSLSRMHADYKADVLFNFFVAACLGVVEQPSIAAFEGRHSNAETAAGLGRVPGLDSLDTANHLLRLLTPALKGHCSKTTIAGLQECMECMGGVGYLENEDMQFNIARLYRDANVLPIWEGTTDMMADDTVLRVLYGKLRDDVLRSLENWVSSVLGLVGDQVRFHMHTDAVRSWWTELRAMLTNAPREEAELKSRVIMERLVDVVQGLLLLVDAVSDNDEVAALVVEEWFERKQQGAQLRADKDWKRQVDANLKIVFGRDGPGGKQAARARL